jgi:hypothetical protein
VSELERVLKNENTGAGVNLPVELEQQLAEVFEAADLLDAITNNQAAAPVWMQVPKEELEPLLRLHLCWNERAKCMDLI